MELLKSVPKMVRIVAGVSLVFDRVHTVQLRQLKTVSCSSQGCARILKGLCAKSHPREVTYITKLAAWDAVRCPRPSVARPLASRPGGANSRLGCALCGAAFYAAVY